LSKSCKFFEYLKYHELLFKQGSDVGKIFRRKREKTATRNTRTPSPKMPPVKSTFSSSNVQQQKYFEYIAKISIFIQM
jgi:hypothetical protein